MQDDITVRVKQNMAINSPIEKPVVNTMLKGFFRLNDAEITNADKSKLDEIDAYLGEYESEMDKVMALKDLRFRLGSPQLGMSELNHFHKYIRIRNSMKQQEAELKALER